MSKIVFLSKGDKIKLLDDGSFKSWESGFTKDVDGRNIVLKDTILQITKIKIDNKHYDYTFKLVSGPTAKEYGINHLNVRIRMIKSMIKTYEELLADLAAHNANYYIDIKDKYTYEFKERLYFSDALPEYGAFPWKAAEEKNERLLPSAGKTSYQESLKKFRVELEKTEKSKSKIGGGSFTIPIKDVATWEVEIIFGDNSPFKVKG